MRISILGFGWLGEPLGKFLQEKGYEVRGSTTTLEKARRLTREGLEAFLFLLPPFTDTEIPLGIFDADILLINLPPASKKHPEGNYLKQIEAVKTLAEKANIRKVIYISSTSVYPSLHQIAGETDDLSLIPTGNKMLLEAEEILWNEKNYQLTVIRFGGLFGGNRIPGKYFSSKSQVVGHAPVNYIHRTDAIRLIYWVIFQELWDQTFNGVAPLHPPRRVIYEHNAETLNFHSPIGYESPESSPWKIVSSNKIQESGFRFNFEDPINFPYVLE